MGDTEDRWAMREFRKNFPPPDDSPPLPDFSKIGHTIDEEWFWNVDDQDYRILIIHHDDCVACMMGVPIEEE